MDFFQHGIVLDELRSMEPKDRSTRVHEGLKVLIDNNSIKRKDVDVLYLKQGLEYKNIESAYVVNGEDADDFIIVSTFELFNRLFNRKFSIGLQKQQPDQKDGYLSTWCALPDHIVDYVIIEAEHKANNNTGALDRGRNRQRQMIEWLYEKFPTR